MLRNCIHLILFSLFALSVAAQTKLPATRVVPDATHRFTTDAEKALWNGYQALISANALSTSVNAAGVSALSVTVGNNTTAIAANTLSLSATTALENEWALRDFWDALYSYNLSPTGKLIGIAGYGDSVGDHFMVPFQDALRVSYPVNGAAYPVNGATFSQLIPTYSGVIPYKTGGTLIDQSNLNGVMPVGSITRSGSTATASFSFVHGFSVGDYATISGATQPEYNGTFPVTGVSGNTFTYTVSGTPATPATGSATIYGGEVDFTYLPNGSHIELSNAASMTLATNVSQYGNTTFRTFLATGPGMGTATVTLTNFATSAVVSTSVVSLSAASLGATVVSFPLSTSIAYKLSITASGKVVHLYSIQAPDNGIIPVSLSRGTSTFTQQNSSSAAILSYLVSQLNIKLIINEAKEEGLPGSLTGMASRLNSLTATSKFIIGSPPDVSTTSVVKTNNVLFRNMALSNGWAYFDMDKAMASSYAEAVRLGWMLDATHASPVLNSYMANMVVGKLNLPSLSGTLARRNVANTNTTSTVLSVVSAVDPTQKVDFATSYGGGDPNVKLYNVREIGFGSGARVANYDANYVQILNSVGGAGKLVVSDVSSSGAGSFAGFISTPRIQGSGSAPTSTTLTGIGTGGTISITGTILGGQITVTTGTAPAAGASVARINFGGNYGMPYLVLTPANDLAATQIARVRAGNPGGFSVDIVTPAGVSLDASATYIWNYVIIR